MESSDEEDARKPAARPTINTTPPLQNESSSADAVVAVPVDGELPFLVTHWLSEYFGGDQHNAGTMEQQAAVTKIHKAAADLASAFSAIGAFGSSVRPSLSQAENFVQSSSVSQQHGHGSSQNATYADLKRAWPSCPADQLVHLMRALQSASSAVDGTVKQRAPDNHIQASAEILLTATRNKISGGRTLQDAIVIAEGKSSVEATMDLANYSAAAVSALQAPVILLDGAAEKEITSDDPILHLRSSAAKFSEAASDSMRLYLDLRRKCHDELTQLRSLERSLKLQQDKLVGLDQERCNLLATNRIHGTAGNVDATALVVQLEEIKTAAQNCERVMAQLQRQLPSLRRAYESDSREHVKALEQATRDFFKSKFYLQHYRDPVGSSRRPNYMNNRILMNISHRQLGIDRYLGRGIPRAMGRIRAAGATFENRKALLYNRFSHAATINTHLSYPVYCLRFDRTGRYFITGSDDYLVKVFCVGGFVNVKNNGQMDPAAYARGAILVCTLKGHAGVINDINVSSDNSFLATASEDGDCRVWGLKDGCPVAILRGHTGGANMVSWSTLTPYRLVTTGADGLARTWDVREACLKRFSRIIGMRPEYHLQVNGKDFSLSDYVELGQASLTDNQNLGDAIQVPPLPVRESSVGNVDASSADNELSVANPLLPLPAAEVASHAANVEEIAGRFIANDMIDEGVKLISKFQHGAILEGGPGTRARRSAVKVICIARCPYGSHFATGSDDGICRIWQDEDNSVVERIDAYSEGSSTSPELVLRTCAARHMTDRLLFTLKGHLSAITDLFYSRRGDRILTASEKDGVVRIWSWSDDQVSAACAPSPHSQLHNSPIRNTSHILIKLTNPNSCTSSEVRQGPRARPNRSQTTTISCDVAVWIHDDSKIVTSQSELAKQSGSNIIPGSQYLFLWDSANGHCLMGIAGGHTMPCPVVRPHPAISSIICSAGADGLVKLWNWETGDCIFSHTNVADFGPIEPSERGKSFGYLDGDFSPDGTILVLTDDSGRVTVFDSAGSQGNSKTEHGSSSVIECPEWMKEQYFSNDYYDLFYDSNGYCVERGSEMPPHLAPRGARCSHSGAPFAAQVNETFKGLSGPIPTCESDARWHRQHIRENANRMRDRRATIRGNLVRQYDPITTTIVQHGRVAAWLKPSNTASLSVVTPRAVRSPAGSIGGSNHRLSSNFRWRDYNDIDFGDDDQEQESDDEDFELNDSIGARRSHGVDDSESDELEVDDEEEIQPSGLSSRRSRRTVHTEVESDNEEVEFTGRNNTPSGPFIADYETHFFKMRTREHGNRVHRQWASRHESTSSYGGQKLYTPQVGDSVVYIPQAHFDTLKKFSIFEAPWHSWPEEAAWPVVSCCIRNIRYRFPYKHYKDCVSIVAKLTLEVTGIPVLSTNRIFGWPPPSFTTPTRSHVFELSVFEHNADDFIFPLGLYVSRLQQLESALSDPEYDGEVEYFFVEDEIEDADFTPYCGNIQSFTNEIDVDMSHPCLHGSGFGSVVICDQGGESTTQLSPWDVSVPAPSNHAAAPERPKLSEDERARVRKALKSIRSLPRVDNYFLFPVEAAYSDYTSRVEVPMDLTFITNRLEADYYGTRYSAVADARLIYYNSIKYNGEDSLSELARELFEKFEEQVLDEKERAIFHKYDAPIVGVQPTASLEPSEALPNTSRNSFAGQRRSQRHGPVRSDLENLPASDESARVQLRQNGHRARPASRQNNVRLRRVGEVTSVLETARIVTVRTLEQLSSSRGQSSRGRSTRSATSAASASAVVTRQGRPASTQARGVPLRATRAGLRNLTFAQVSADVDETGRAQFASTRGILNGRAERSSRRAETRAQFSLPELALSEQVAGSEARSSRQMHISTANGSSSRPTRSSARAISRSSLGVGDLLQTEVNASAGRRWPSVGTDQDGPSETDEDKLSTPRRRSPRRASGGEASTQSQRYVASIHNHSDTEDVDPVPQSKQTRYRQTRCKMSKEPDDSSFEKSQSENESEFDDGEDYRSASSESDESTSSRSNGSEIEAVATHGANTRRASRSRAARREDESSRSESRAVPTRRARSGASQSCPAKYEDHSSGSESRDITTRVTRRGASQSLSGRRNSETSTRPLQRKCASAGVRRESDDATRTPRARTFRSFENNDHSASEFEDNVSNKATENGLKSRTAKKRKAKLKTSPRKKIKSEIEVVRSINVAKWPEIAMSNISKVSTGVLECLRKMDELGTFSIPVTEAYPEIATTYKKRILHPMDFRTIEQVRLSSYKSITELQDDLILVFRNCMEYNEPGSPVYAAASVLLNALDETFHEVCKSLNVRTLHH